MAHHPFDLSDRRLSRLLLVVGLLLVVVGCASTPVSRSLDESLESDSREATGARLESQDEYSFRVTEVVRVGSGVRHVLK